MIDKKWGALLIVLNLIIINGVILAVFNLSYPFLGHDYIYGITSMLDSALHFRLNGLTIQWFTPSFGGGIPAYPNPNNGQFSLLALLTVFLPPWQAVMLTVVIYTSTGFIACEYFLRHSLGLHSTASILGAVLFSANGFMIERVAVGHLGYITFPLFPLFLILLVDRSLPVGYASAILGIVTASLIHFAGYFILIIFGLSILTTLPLLSIHSPVLLNWKKLLATLAIGGILALVISASKLAAVYSFMRFFPRTITDEYNTPVLLSLVGIVLQLMGTMNLVPLFLIAGLRPDMIPAYLRSVTDANLGYWEVDMSLSPVVFLILLVGIINIFHSRRKSLTTLFNGKRKIAWICLFLALWLNIEFILAKGWIYPQLRRLPILSSLHINVRFAAALIFPLVLSAVLLYNKWIKDQLLSKSWVTFYTANILAIVFFGTYFLFKEDYVYRFYDITDGQKTYQQMQAGKSFEVTEIGKTRGNSNALLDRVSNLNLYEPAFGYKLEDFHPQVEAGPIWKITNGYFNMTDPTGYVYPELNNNKPFDRFRVEDEEPLKLFVKHLQPDWKIPTYQRVLNWISGMTFLTTLIYVITQSALNNRNKTSQ
ncbi:MAG: hypothetical protein ABI904_08225 [Chloroflexota bacterium]